VRPDSLYLRDRSVTKQKPGTDVGPRVDTAVFAIYAVDSVIAPRAELSHAAGHGVRARLYRGHAPWAPAMSLAQGVLQPPGGG